VTARVEMLTPRIEVKYKDKPGLFIEPQRGKNILESMQWKTPNKYKTERSPT